ncbi:MAG: (d)CMP kinase [Pseudomonadota bacterium]
MHPIITIDGPAGSGKSTVSKLLAKRLNFCYLDTGAMYRAVALQAKRGGIPSNDGERLYVMCTSIDLHFKKDGEDVLLHLGDEDISSAIRSPEMDMLSSAISAVNEVRKAMTELQQKIGRSGRLIAEGRDMGTVVFPHAEYKFFITASPEARAERRYQERVKRGESVLRTEVGLDLKKRDQQDETRAIAPLKPAWDARIIDTSRLSPEQVVEEMLRQMGMSDKTEKAETYAK